jgi:sulfur-carrier protein adenylyltransferase/sulfurtransferase
MPRFSYDLAFDRNIGWLTDWEQQALRFKRVAIAGMGGVGGVHLLTLARFGIGAFNIADFDRFDIVNFNRQIGANTATIGRPKAEVLEEMARAVNPELLIRRFDQGIDDSNIDAFLDGVDVFVDGFDYFVLDIRRKVYARCAELGIPALCAAPIGMGVGFLAFLPGQMSFERYFRLEGKSELEQYLRFLVGLVPRALHRAYLVDPSRLDLANKRGPSTGASCQLCSGVAAVTAVKLMLGRAGVPAVPYHHHYDPYVGKLAVTRLRWGNAGPLQSLKIALGKRGLAALARQKPPPPEPPPGSPIEEILRAARWAPSGDNVQPWRFEILDENSVRVRLDADHADNVYEYRDGEPTLIAGGVLLESLRVAATGWHRAMTWSYEGLQASGSQGAPRRHVVRVDFSPSGSVTPDRWLPHLMLRSVDRRRYRARPLTAHETQCLTDAAGAEIHLEWHRPLGTRLRLALLGARATDIRLRTPEAYEVHRRMLDFGRKHSPDGIPGGAVGLDRATLAIMRWAMRRWSRLRLLNRLGGTWSTAAQLDLLPGLASGAFFTMRLARPAPEPDATPEQRMAALLGVGEGVQRFWLEASRLGLAVQPALAILAFAQYGEAKTPFSADPAVVRKAGALATRFRQVLGDSADAFVFMGRIGQPLPRLPVTRSTRHPLEQLIEGDHRGHVRPASSGSVESPPEPSVTPVETAPDGKPAI